MRRAASQREQGLELAPGAWLANGEHDRHRFRQQPSRDESEDLVRGGVEPLRVIHETEQRTLLGDRRQQTEHGQGDEEPVGSIAGRQAQRDTQSVPLVLRESAEPSIDRSAKLMHCSERQLHLSLDAGDLRDTKATSLPRGVPQQGRLSDASLTTDDHDATLAAARVHH